MPRQQINLEPYRDEIIALFQHGISSDSISRTLESRYNIQVKERTIQSRLRKWGIRKRSRTTTADEVLHARIKVLFMQDRLTDKAMLKLLRQDGYDISERTLRRLRFQLGLHARVSTFEQERGVRPVSVPLPIAMSVPVLAAKDGQGSWPATLPEPVRE
jgi:repressor of nif and glnA expression